MLVVNLAQAFSTADMFQPDLWSVFDQMKMQHVMQNISKPVIIFSIPETEYIY